MRKIETVLILYQHPNILLGMKKKRFGKGKYNGFGGKVEEGETLEQAAIRETLEESGLNIKNPEKMGEILFHFTTEEPDHLVHFFRAREFFGDLKESDEMVSKWFHIDNIPYDEMWAGDRYWLPLLIRGEQFKGEFYFGDKLQILKHELRKLE